MADATTVLAVEISADPSKLLEGVKTASTATGAWGDAAARVLQKVQASFNGVTFEATTSKAKAAAIEMVQLRHQVDVAQAAGDTATVKALQQQIELIQKVNALRRAGFAHGDATEAARGQVEAIAAAREAAEAREAAAKRAERIRGNPAEALQSVFARSRIGVLEEGGAKIPIFGSSLEALGAAGVTAAAGLAAAAGAAEMVIAAAERSEEIENTAKKIGVTTQALQEYQFAALATGTSEEAMNQALQKGNEVLGAFQANLAQGKTKKIFEALGITQEDARKAQSITDLIPEIADKLKGLSTTEQGSIVERLFGSQDLLPFFQRGKEGIEELRQEAEATGAVFDHDLISKGAQLAEQLKLAHLEVDTNLKRAFIELAPLIAKCAGFAAELARGAGDALEFLKPIAQRSSTAVNDALASDRRELAASRPLAGRVDAKTGLADTSGLANLNPVAHHYNIIKREIDQLSARQQALVTINAQPGEVHTGSTAPLVASKVPKPKADTTQSQDDTARNALDAAGKDLASALKDRGVAERKAAEAVGPQAVYEKAVSDAAADATDRQTEITADLNSKLDALNEKEVKVRADVHDANQTQQLTTLEAAKAKEEDAAAQRGITAATQASAAKEKAARDFQIAQIALAGQLLGDNAKYVQSLHQIAQGYSRRSTAEKRQGDLQALADQKVIDDIARKTELDIAVGSLDPHAAGYEQQKRDLTAKAGIEQGRADNLYQAQVGLTNYRDVDPLTEWVRQGMQSAGQLHDAIETSAVRAMDDFNGGLASAIVNGKSLGDVFHSIFTTMEEDVVRYLAKQAEISLFGGSATGAAGATASPGLFSSLLSFFVPHHAQGTDNAPGGWSLVGEDGPELLNLPRGSQVATNSTLRGLASMSASSMSRSVGGLVANINVDAGGAFSFDHVATAVEGGVRRAVAASGMQIASAQRRQSITAKNDLSRY